MLIHVSNVTTYDGSNFNNEDKRIIDKKKC